MLSADSFTNEASAVKTAPFNVHAIARGGLVNLADRRIARL